MIFLNKSEKEKAKLANIKINDFVEKYYKTFHAWKPETKVEIFVFNLVKNSFLVSIILPIFLYFWLIYCNISEIGNEYFVSGIIVMFITLTMHFIYFFIGMYIFKKNSNNYIVKYLDVNWGMRFELGTKEELERLWVEKLTDGNEGRLNHIISKVKNNMDNKKPNTRELEYIFSAIFKNPYIAGFLILILTVVLTTILNPLSNEIDGNNFMSIGAMLIFSGVGIWIFIVMTLIFVVKLFLTFIYSYELAAQGNALNLWRYEKLISTLSHYQSLSILNYEKLDEDTRVESCCLLSDNLENGFENKFKRTTKSNYENNNGHIVESNSEEIFESAIERNFEHRDHSDF